MSEQAHANWRMKTDNNYEFASHTNAVLATAVEFIPLSREYPIVFIEHENEIRPVAVMGLRSDQNLFVDDQYQWLGNYIPAYIRRYPFIFAGDKNQTQEGAYTVCIDEEFSGFDQIIGEPLFSESGEHSAYLEQAILFLREYQAQGQTTLRFCNKLRKLDLLEPMQAHLKSKDGKDISLAGFMLVSIERLKKKKPVELAELVKSDEMALIYQHLASLDNFTGLVERYSAPTVNEV